MKTIITKEQALESIRSEWDTNWVDYKELDNLEASMNLKSLSKGEYED